jgi:hypothetical protein
VRAGDRVASGLVPPIRLPGVAVVQDAGERDVPDLVRQARQVLREDGGTVTGEIEARAGRNPQILGFEWEDGGVRGSTAAYRCDPTLVVTTAEGSPQDAGICQRAQLQQACEDLYLALLPALTDGALELLKGDGNGTQERAADDEDLTFQEEAGRVTAALSHTFLDNSASFVIGDVREGFREAGWGALTETCGGVPCGNSDSRLPYRAILAKPGLRATVDITDSPVGPRLTLRAKQDT